MKLVIVFLGLAAIFAWLSLAGSVVADDVKVISKDSATGQLINQPGAKTVTVEQSSTPTPATVDTSTSTTSGYDVGTSTSTAGSYDVGTSSSTTKTGR